MLPQYLPVATVATLTLAVSTISSGLNAADLQLDPLYVTANRMPQTLNATVAAVTVITSEEIARQQPRDLTELLNGLPGVVVSNQGPAGQVGSMMLRGTASKHTVVLLDGVRINESTSGSAPLELIDPAQIERIEIVRGPRSQLYGADAVGGVIHLITRRSEANRTQVRLGVGSDATYHTRALLQATAGERSLSMQLSGRRSDGFSAMAGSHPDNDGYQQTSASLSWREGYGERFKSRFTLLLSDGEADYDTSPEWGGLTVDDTTETSLRSGELGVDWVVNESWDMGLTLGYSRDSRDFLADGLSTYQYHTRRQQLNWQNNLYLSDRGLLTVGGEWLGDGVGGRDAVFSQSERDNRALFMNYLHEELNYSVAIGGRWDDNDAYGEYQSGNVEWGWRFVPRFQLTAGFGTAFRAPHFLDLYGYGGNPELAVERSRSFELGLKGEYGASQWALRGFRNRIDEMIIYLPAEYDAEFNLISEATNANVDQAMIEGVELELDWQNGGWFSELFYTWLTPRDVASDKLLPNRPQQSGRLQIGYREAHYGLATQLNGRGGSYSDKQNLTEVGGYATLDLRFDYRLHRHLQLEAKVSNLLDREYQQIKGYHTDGRSWMVSFNMGQ
ncbi:TonB-dependent receptor [Ectothiorhodospiraceae bacterium BW-2]|nr:TonB-dependent receptor [Ectothiorhodospiraceae bacterium BW-2]